MNDRVDDDDDAELHEPPPTEAEVRAAEALRAALERPDMQMGRREASGDTALLEVALRARAALGHAQSLDVSVRTAAVDAAIRGARARAPQTRARTGLWLAAAAALLVAASGAGLAARFVTEPSPLIARALPDDAYTRPTDALFGEGLTPDARASARLDAIVSSRTRGYFAVVAADLAAERDGEAK